MLVACLVGAGSARALALSPDYIRRFFGAVLRRVQEHAGQQVALVVGHADLRPFLRSILAGLPELPVLKTREVPAPRYIGPLALSEHDDEAFQQFFQHTAFPDPPLPLS